MRRVADEFSDRVLIGEIYLPFERLVAYYGRDLAGVHLPFNFSLLSANWHALSIARLIGEYEAALPAGGWPGEDCSDAAADLARHADDLLWRRDCDGRGCNPA